MRNSAIRTMAMAGIAYGVAVFGVTTGLNGCTSIPVVTKPDPCGGWSPIIPDGKDALTTDTANQILAHDCRGYKLKCWNPPGIADACAPVAAKAPLPGTPAPTSTTWDGPALDTSK